MNLEDFNFVLPKELIASRPLQDRDMSRLLVMEDGALKAALFKDLKCFLRPGDLLVINDTKVFKARLNCFKMSGAKVEIMTERILDKYRITAQTKSNSKLLEGDEILVNSTDIRAVLEKKDGYLSYFNFTSPIKEILEKYGNTPLPPYIKRDIEKIDQSRYQTVYANSEKLNSVAAPTAGLHFDHHTLRNLKDFGVNITSVTLDIGLGTFKPLKKTIVEENSLHKECIELSEDAIKHIQNTKLTGSRVVAVGTTVLRCLEAVNKYNKGYLKSFKGETDIFIYPGFKFGVVDALITNFHLPCSSLFLLVSAFGGPERVKMAYLHAIQSKFRFFSYGDAMFIV